MMISAQNSEQRLPTKCEIPTRDEDSDMRINNREDFMGLMNQDPESSSTHCDETAAITKLMYDMLGNKERADQYPSEDTSKKLSKNIEKLVAKELYQMKKDTREAIVLEIHGVKSRSVAESPELIECALEAFEKELQTTKYKERVTDINGRTHVLDRGHLRATNDLQSNYVTSPEFRIRFLRTEFFVVEKAVVRYCKNLNCVWDLFGDIALVRQVCLSDLSKKEQKYLKAGQVQCMMSRDKMGRRIYVVSGPYSVSIRERIRVEVYLNFAVIGDDESSQKYGTIHLVFYSLREDSIPFDQAAHSMLAKFIKCTPIRSSAVHICMPEETIYSFFKAIVQSILPRDIRAGLRVHTGSPIECNYAMGQFGIPADAIPRSASGTVKMKSVQKFFKARMAVEMYQEKRRQLMGVDYVTKAMERELIETPLSRLGIPTSCPGTDCPDLNCIVFGDREFYNHPGNIMFREYLRGKRLLQEQRKEKRKLQQKEGKQNEQSIVGNFLEDIIDETSKTNQFAIYNKEIGWYAYISPNSLANRQELRKRISQLVRDERKRDRFREMSTVESPTPFGGGGGGSVSNIGLDAKRFKQNEGCGGCGSSQWCN